MTDAMAIAIIVSIAPTVTAAAAVWTIYRTKKVAIAKLEHIEKLTNSTLTAATKRIAELEAIVAKMIQERDG